MENYTLSVDWNPVFGDPKPAALRIGVSEQRLNENGWYDIVGEVTNTGSRNTALVHVIATFYDETGKLIESEFTYLTSAVPAGQSIPFKITEFSGDEANDAESVKLTVESADYVMIDPELEQQQLLQGMQQQQQQQQPQSQRQNQRVSVSIVPGSSTLTDDAYEPNSVIVTTGATTRWTNDDSVPHTATSGEDETPDGRFDSGIMAPAATFEYTFTEAGEYSYFCLLHPNMVGTVTVT